MTIDTLTHVSSNVVAMGESLCGMMLKADAFVTTTCFYQNFDDNKHFVQNKWTFCVDTSLDLQQKARLTKSGANKTTN